MSENPVASQRPEVARLTERFPNAILKVKDELGETFVCLRKENLVEVAAFLRDEPEFAYRYFVECLGVDYSTWPHARDLEGRFEVVYNLYSMKNLSRIFLKVGVDDGETVPTLMHLWGGAEYPEREVSDLFGIIFAGNEPEGRFLLPDDWVGYPLRKEYPLGGEDVLFDGGTRGPAVEDRMAPHAGESFEGKTGTEDISGR